MPGQKKPGVWNHAHDQDEVDDGTLPRTPTPAPAPVGTHPHKKKHKRRHSGDPLQRAFQNATKFGWIAYFREAARANNFTPELLLAVAYRETGLNPKYLRQAGDNGHGYGLMQADIRSFKAWIDSGKWKNAHACITKGAEVLQAKRDEIRAGQKKSLTVKDHAGKAFTFTGKEINDNDLLRVTVAAYNCGLWAYYHYSHGHDIDKGTTGANYSRDVMKNAERFRALLRSPAEHARGPMSFPDHHERYRQI